MTAVVDALTVAEQVTDPELPMLTLADLGVLRSVADVNGRVVVTITPTYSGCPAMHAMREDLVRALRAAGHTDVELRTVLTPAWTSDWISASGRQKLAEAGIAPPGPAASESTITLGRRRPPERCPRCGSLDTEEVSRFGATACKALHRCRSCLEPFEHFKAF